MPEKHPKRPTAKNRYAKAIEKYYATLAEFEYQGALHEGAVSTAKALPPSPRLLQKYDGCGTPQFHVLAYGVFP
jgi:hypothetical protein